ncbi:LytTR family DNA-binding domain-containing protein [Leptospira kmetyi]|uniref:LytTR family DNA-binding domain-containing protein n=1 Tax=Leptospira kmetyi TaxID=408139 RepID=UPI000F63D1F8|nr:LytTR family DNA-binding domain-containing protein [Leptospira kmetyi]
MKLNEMESNEAMFRGVDRNRFVTFSNIVYISSNGRYSVLHTLDQNLEVVGTLKQILQKLKSKKFARVYKQYIINMEFLGHVEYLTDGVHFAYRTDEEKSQVPMSGVYLTYTTARED